MACDVGYKRRIGTGLVARFERNLRPSPDFAMLELPNWLTVLGAALLIGAILLPGTLGYFAKSAVYCSSAVLFGGSVCHSRGGKTYIDYALS